MTGQGSSAGLLQETWGTAEAFPTASLWSLSLANIARACPAKHGLITHNVAQATITIMLLVQLAQCPLFQKRTAVGPGPPVTEGLWEAINAESGQVRDAVKDDSHRRPQARLSAGGGGGGGTCC